MPAFTTVIPDDPRGHSLTLVRVPPGKPVVGIVVSDNLIGCATHFWGGRTIPHEEQLCFPCSEGSPWRWHAWLAAFSTRNNEMFLFESTKRVAMIFAAYRETHGTLRGCVFKAQRATDARNSRVRLELKPGDLRSINLPEEPNLVKCMSMIWNIKLPDLAVECVIDGIPAVRTISTPDNDKPLPNQTNLKFHDESRSETA